MSHGMTLNFSLGEWFILTQAAWYGIVHIRFATLQNLHMVSSQLLSSERIFRLLGGTGPVKPTTLKETNMLNNLLPVRRLSDY